MPCREAFVCPPHLLEQARASPAAGAGEVEGAVVDGPLALDNAVSAGVAAVKGIDGAVAGRADIVVVPNIEYGSALYKAMVYFMSATAAVLVAGARAPIVPTSRADPPGARLAAAALAAIVAAHEGAWYDAATAADDTGASGQ